ncbi:hypothetical protein [Leptolyngbya iicbica]|uniref:Uncharacterized protein n=2 Tax=Cyanophyceae TaxID=3028117 RepID=A0A4Q7E187_9CYAN|nr:hypothetical protein [Leptolyngbya sp. LK]RZM75265.1 hypothetical protein DYY88_21790 [Leptolyngbya sp. LK]
MHHTSMPTNPALTRQHRLRAIVKRLVIELGYLEYCLAAGLEDTNLQTAALSIDTAIDCLNEHLVP